MKAQGRVGWEHNTGCIFEVDVQSEEYSLQEKLARGQPS